MCLLPGIGPATAGDMMAFAWNIPVVVVETNIRSVFIHFFFKDKEKVTDAEIFPLIEKTLDKENPRDWYSALFDYGAYLKQTSNPSRRSAHHSKQSAFAGSVRQKRAQILRMILEKPLSEKQIQKATQFDVVLIFRIIVSLQKEGLVQRKKNGLYCVA